MHVGVDNLNVVRHVSRVFDDRCTSKPFSLVTDSDLLLRIQQFVRWRGLDNAAVSKVKGHADEGLVALGRSVRSTLLVIMRRMLPLLGVGSVCIILLLMLEGWLLGLVHAGTP